MAGEDNTANLSLRIRSQQTISRPVSFRGLSLFHGYDSSVRVLPAAGNAGIHFVRIDLDGSSEIPANVKSLRKEPRRTVLSADGAHVETVEHLMAALAGLQIDNCTVEINCPEVPAYDGSCRAFCDGILEAGIEQLPEVTAPVSVDRVSTVQSSDGRQVMLLRPYVHACPAITYQFDYGSRAPVSPQQLSAEIRPEMFYEEISAARTFVLESEIAALRKMGYGQHLTAKDVLVIGKDGPIDNTFRWPDECVRHKILDCVGDLALASCNFHGHVTASRTGHHLNHEMARVLTMMNADVANSFLKAV